MLATVDQFLTIEGMQYVSVSVATQLLEAASDAWVEETERPWEYQEEIVEYVPGFRTPYLTLSRLPLVAVSEVEYRGEVVPSTAYRIDAASGVLIKLDGVWAWTAQPNHDITEDRAAGTERADYKVTYSAGYVTRNQATDLMPATLPRYVERHVLDCAVALYWRRGRDTSLTAKSTARGNVTYRDDGLPSSFLAAAHRERRLRR